MLGKVTLLNDEDTETADDTNNTSLRSVGVYYLAGGEMDMDGLRDVVRAAAQGMLVRSP